MAGAPPALGRTGTVSCCLENAYDLATLVAALQLRDKEKDQLVHCEANAQGFKFISQSAGKDVAVQGWIFAKSFRDYKIDLEAGAEAIHLKLPVEKLLSCLQIFSDKAEMALRYPADDSMDLTFTLTEDQAVTEVRMRTMVLTEAPQHFSFLQQGDDVTQISLFRTSQAEAWYQLLSELEGLDGADVVLQITLRACKDATDPAVILRAQTVTDDAEVELQRDCLDEFQLSPSGLAAGGVSFRYHLGSVLSSQLRAAKDAKGVKVRFNDRGIMSTQFIMRSRGQPEPLFVEALVSPRAEQPPFPAAATPFVPSRTSGAAAAQLGVFDCE
eukprot:TRINITY_DN17364_c0_g1_i1.p1 TRINITY_DN17364_c0_g1~~TRINITY_DN17364_c0_g1_i1.p1  ORF type:complete len:328 (+),score=80.75 TRINITY_DN17364_c0_g1_i1:79-1062(+)